MTIVEQQLWLKARNIITQAQRRRGHNVSTTVHLLGCSRSTLQKWLEDSCNPFAPKGSRRYCRAIADYCGLTQEQARAAWEGWRQERVAMRADLDERVMSHYPEAEERISFGIDAISLERTRKYKPDPEKNFVYRLLVLKDGLSPRGIADELNGIGSRNPVTPSQASYVTQGMVSSWFAGRSLPWHHAGGAAFKRLAKWTGLEETMLKQHWADWLDSRFGGSNEGKAKGALA